MNTRALLYIAAAALAAWLLTRPKPTTTTPAVTPFQIAGPYMPVALRSTLLPANIAVDPRTAPPVTNAPVV